jgi:NTP pyrophosphatase (non-canonical NTP hydrolase)
MNDDELKMRDDRTSPRKPSLDDLCKKALSAWGFDPQMDMVIEEMSELTKAILKYRRDPTQGRAMHLAEEIADVKIMIRQLDIAMANLYGEDFKKWESDETFMKLHRLEGMLERFDNK